MLDINLIRTNPKLVKDNLKKRRDLERIKWIDDLLKKDKEWRSLKLKADKLRAKRNKISHEINMLKKQKKSASKKIKEIKSIPDKIKKLEEKQDELHDKIRFYLLRIPNLMHKSVPYGKDDTENVEVRRWGKIPKFNFPIKSHVELIEDLNVGDFDRSAKVIGSGFYYLKGDLALLNQALIRFAIDFLTKKKYLYVEPPLMLKRDIYEGVIDLADFEKMMYKIEDEDAYLIATSEHPIAAMHANENIDERKLPLKYVGYSICFRKEIGAHGIDEKGLFRTHQFNKVEQFIFCKPADSWKYHEELIKNSEEMFKALGIPYRVTNICTGDLGIIAAKKYDLEAWMPRQNCYKEVCSASNCTDYQARRLNVNYGKRDSGKKQLLHTLNNTAIATSRAMVAILENFQQKDGSVTVPKVLRSYMNGLKEIKKVC